MILQDIHVKKGEVEVKVETTIYGTELLTKKNLYSQWTGLILTKEIAELTVIALNKYLDSEEL